MNIKNKTDKELRDFVLGNFVSKEKECALNELLRRERSRQPVCSVYKRTPEELEETILDINTSEEKRTEALDRFLRRKDIPDSDTYSLMKKFSKEDDYSTFLSVRIAAFFDSDKTCP